MSTIPDDRVYGDLFACLAPMAQQSLVESGGHPALFSFGGQTFVASVEMASPDSRSAGKAILVIRKAPGLASAHVGQLGGVPPAPDVPAFPGMQWVYRDGRWEVAYARSATTVRTESRDAQELASRSAEQALESLLARR